MSRRSSTCRPAAAPPSPRCAPCCPICGRRGDSASRLRVLWPASAWCWPRWRRSTSRWSTATRWTRCRPRSHPATVPLALILGYGLLRVASAGFGELRDAVFAAVQQRTTRRVALETFRHMHGLSLRFHLDRQTGGVSRAIERGVAGIQQVLRLAVFNLLPTLFEVLLVTGTIWALFDWRYAAVTFGAVASYIGFTVGFTTWRVKYRRQMNEVDSEAQHQGARQPAELRDGQVFRQRGARGRPLRQRARPLRDGGGGTPGHAQHAEHRPGRHHRRRAGADHADGGRGVPAAA